MGFKSRFLPALTAGQHITGILDGSCPKQRFPMCLPRGIRKIGRHDQHLRTVVRHQTIQLGKAKIIADGKSQPSDIRICQTHRLPRQDLIGFSVAWSILHSHIKHMQLTVRCHTPSLRRKQHGQIPSFFLILFRYASRMQPHTIFSGHIGKPLRDPSGYPTGMPCHIRSYIFYRLRKHHQNCSMLHSLAGPLFHFSQIFFLVLLRIHLHQSHPEILHSSASRFLWSLFVTVYWLASEQ